jgi:sulfoxide reductase catalytic subunit YedY
MLIKKPADILPSEITPESVYHQRRTIVAGLLGASAALALPAAKAKAAAPAATLAYKSNPKYVVADKTNSYEEITGYNNYYELGTDKGDPARNAGSLKSRPWSVEIAGECDVKGKYTIEDILKPHALE